jgi:hypothetical protein
MTSVSSPSTPNSSSTTTCSMRTTTLLVIITIVVVVIHLCQQGHTWTAARQCGSLPSRTAMST